MTLSGGILTTLVVIGANDVVAHEATALRVETVHVLRAGLVGIPGARVINTDYLDHDKFALFVDSVLRPLAPAAVISLTELGLEPAAIANERLGTPGVPLEVVRSTRDKYRMRSILQHRAPHLNPPFALADDADALNELFSGGRPLIAKPVDGAGSADVRLLLEESEFPAAMRTRATLVEQYVSGTEYSIETLSRAGQHTIIGIAQKGWTTGFVESSHVMPPANLAELDRAKMEVAVRELLDALELADGASHTEIKLDEAGRPYVIETHNRTGGDGIADLVRMTTGINWRRAALGWPIGAGFDREPRATGAAATVFFVAAPGRVSKVAQPPELNSATIESWHVSVAPGDVIGPLRSSEGRLGGATISAPDPAACLSAVRQLTTMQIVTTTTEDYPAAPEPLEITSVMT